MAQITVVLADDHPIIRQGLRELLEPEGFTIIGEAGDGLQALNVVAQKTPDVLVVDLLMPGLPGLEVARRVARSSPKTRIIVYSMQRDDAAVITALRNGAAAYVLKDAPANEVLAAIRAVRSAPTQRYVSAALAERGLEDQAKGRGPDDPYETLTRREREVLQLMIESHTVSDIADRLFISPRTVETHRTNVFRKLNCKNHTDLVRFAVRRGLLPLQ